MQISAIARDTDEEHTKARLDELRTTWNSRNTGRATQLGASAGSDTMNVPAPR